MGMNVGSSEGSGDPEVMVEINTTPLIDVMLVLLVMLIITIPIQLHAVNLNMPVGNPPPPTTPPEVIDIDVDFDGTILWNREYVTSRKDLEDKFKAASLQANQPEVHLRPNKLVSYKYVAMVMATAQHLGMNKIGLVGNEQYAQ